MFDFNEKHDTENIHQERNAEKIAITFFKNIFKIKFLPCPSILLVSIGSHVAKFIGIL